MEGFIEALRGTDSATVANAIEGLGVRDRTEGYADLRLRCLISQPEPMVGYAVTFKVDSTTPGRTVEGSRFPAFVDAVSESPKPCVVVCEESGPEPLKGCHMGDVVGTRLAYMDVVGAVSGSGIRDLDGMRAVGLSGFALGTVVGHGVWTITDVNVEVEVAGLRVCPGDLLHGDGNGLVTVPTGHPSKLLALIEEVRSRESELRRSSSAPAGSNTRETDKGA
jgi:regulator of RNase E activity RraA